MERCLGEVVQILPSPRKLMANNTKCLGENEAWQGHYNFWPNNLNDITLGQYEPNQIVWLLESNRLEVLPSTNFWRLPGKMFKNWREKLLLLCNLPNSAQRWSSITQIKWSWVEKSCQFAQHRRVKHTSFSIFCQKCRNLSIFSGIIWNIGIFCM